MPEVRKMTVTPEDIFVVLNKQSFTSLFEQQCEAFHAEALSHAKENQTEQTTYTVHCSISMTFDTSQAEIKVEKGVSASRKPIKAKEPGIAHVIQVKGGVGENALGLTNGEGEQSAISLQDGKTPNPDEVPPATGKGKKHSTAKK